MPANYLRDYTTGAAIKLMLKNGIYVMKTIDTAQVSNALKMEAAVAASANGPSEVAGRV